MLQTNEDEYTRKHFTLLYDTVEDINGGKLSEWCRKNLNYTGDMVVICKKGEYTAPWSVIVAVEPMNWPEKANIYAYRYEGENYRIGTIGAITKLISTSKTE